MTDAELVDLLYALPDHGQSVMDAVESRVNGEYETRSDAVERRLEDAYAGRGAFADDELRYAAFARCPCGAGMAYPKDIGMRGSWDCSDILTGRAALKGQPGATTHEARLPFTFYDIKSEDQPSANGNSTRRVAQ